MIGRLGFLVNNLAEPPTSASHVPDHELIGGWAFRRALRSGTLTVAVSGEPLVAFAAGSRPRPVTAELLRSAWFDVEAARDTRLTDDAYERAAAELRRRVLEHVGDPAAEQAIAREVADARGGRRSTRNHR
jgi:hypothetical protein